MRAVRRRWPEGTWMKLTSGKILRGQMDLKGLSNEDVAKHAGVGRTFISALVNERRTSCTPRVAELIAERCEISLEILFVPRGSTISSRSVPSSQTRKRARSEAAA